MPDFRRRIPIQGLITDLVTLFANGSLDLQGIATLVNWQIASGVSGLAACGRLGEATSLSREERRTVLAAVVQAAGLSVPVIASVGTYATEATITLALDAEAEGVDALIVTTPYYSKPTQKGIIAHMRAVADACALPILVLADPAATSSDVTAETLWALSDIPGVHGFIDASGDIARLAVIDRKLRERLVLYSAHDTTAFAFNVLGGSGTFSTAANLAPRLTSAMHQALRTRNVDLALDLKDRLAPLFSALGETPDPANIKHGLASILGLAETVRLPLVPVAPLAKAAIDSALAGLPECAVPLARVS
ncbi:4-hydroxy-tetrahydrodipicolinate synthase [Shinella curvata]|uniref:4-hydroxy-tetrahydrodipicolinate synthase n=1 Tax=Shinella curvata TaxID=1817964 RepID=A0ABT8XAP4_9HYPH|nr:dihydrodipicolinate synthase family protein [Shinella curvata]MCJ8054796.1 4-hydroxy-tetrahydrodipicolinate synthase [Shinella curvata]MDO6120809.1 4-hydroxy-tetrahydrodipicolinate synthase [Shinella curvata]